MKKRGVWRRDLLLLLAFLLLSLPALVSEAVETWKSTYVGVPAGRAYHTAVWTGTQMIVWGGWNGSNYLNTGGRYSPATNAWTPTSTTGAPASRYLHTAVWTGSQMIVWGGYDGGCLNTGGRYNPATNAWTETSTTGAPASRYLHTAVWTGTEMIVWGGYDGSKHVNTGGRYNPAENTWTGTSTTEAPEGRYYHTAVWTGTEMIVWGGCYDSGGYIYLKTGGRYNPATNGWSPTLNTGAPGKRAYHTAVWTGTEMIVWGGYDGGCLNTGDRYTP